MPANLTPQYLEAEKRYKQASSREEKTAALEEMLALIPKHKGTEKLQADLKSKLSKLRAESQKAHSSGGKRSQLDVVEKEGAGQVLLLGAPNTGKSSLLAALTRATPEIADYPYTTRMPQPGMMLYENIQIQLVDLPAISPESWQPRLSGIIRNADSALLLADLSSADVLEQIESVLSLLEESKILLDSCRESRLPFESARTLRTVLVGTKTDMDTSREASHILTELYGSRFTIVSVSSRTAENLSEIKTLIFQMLDIIRVYSKPPGKQVDLNNPFVLKRGSTVLAAAAHIHKDFSEKLKFARIWGSEKFDGQMVHRDHRLEDGDIVEFHL